LKDQLDPIQTRDGNTVNIDFFQPQDALGIVELFKEVYGEGYPIKLYYDSEALIQSNARGDCCSIVAREETGRVVGVTHAVRTAPFEDLYESAAGLVLKSYRSQGISKRLQWFLLNRWPVSRPEVVGIFGEPVCNHVQLQKTWDVLGAVETGLEVALMPAEAYGREKGGHSRVACLMAYYPFRNRPQCIFLPDVYAEVLPLLYQGLSEERSFVPSLDPLPPDRQTRYQSRIFNFASLARVTFEDTGKDLGLSLEAIEREGKERNLKVIQIHLKLGCPWIGEAVHVFRSQGYFIGGVLPRWFDEDGLLMQKLFCPPDWEEIQLYTDRSKEILRIIRADYDQVKG
jgi:hypothetical protein